MRCVVLSLVYILPYTLSQWLTDRAKYFDEKITLEAPFDKNCTNGTSQERSFTSVIRPVAVPMNIIVPRDQYRAQLYIMNMAGKTTEGDVLKVDFNTFGILECIFQAHFSNNDKTRLDCAQFLYVKGLENKKEDIKASNPCTFYLKKTHQMVYCYQHSDNKVLGFVHQLLTPYNDEEGYLSSTPSRGMAFYDKNHKLVPGNNQICPYNGFENPEILPSPQCRAEYIGNNLVRVKCATTNVLPLMCCKYTNASPRSRSTSQSVDFKTETDVAVSYSIIDAFGGTQEDERLYFSSSCQADLFLADFDKMDNEHEISIDWYACSKDGRKIGRSGTTGSVVAELHLPIPHFLPSCGQYSKWTGECTCYLAEHMTQDKQLMNFAMSGNQSMSVDWYQDGELIDGQTRNKQLDTLPDKLLADYVIMSTTITADQVRNGTVVTCKGRSDLTDLWKDKIKEEHISKTFSPIEGKWKKPVNGKAKLLDCTQIMMAGEIARCTCYNKHSNLLQLEDIQWYFCDVKFKCEKKIPTNARLVEGMDFSVLFLYHNEEVEAYYLRCTVGNESSVEHTIIVEEASSPSSSAIIAYVMIPTCVIVLGLMAISLKFFIRWYMEMNNTIFNKDEIDDNIEEGKEDGTILTS